jgi:hypothetical protein
VFLPVTFSICNTKGNLWWLSALTTFIVDPIQRTNMRGLMADRFRAFDLHTEGNRFESRWILFSFNFFPFISCVIFFRRIFQYYQLSFLQLIFLKFQNRLVQCLALVMWLVVVPRVHDVMYSCHIVYIPQMNPCLAPRDPCRWQAWLLFQLWVKMGGFREPSAFWHWGVKINLLWTWLHLQGYRMWKVTRIERKVKSFSRHAPLLICIHHPGTARIYPLSWGRDITIYIGVFP